MGFLTAVSAVSSTDVWAVGHFQSDRIRPLAEHWNGTNWTRTALPHQAKTYGEVDGVSAVSTNDVWAVGAIARGATHASWIEHWNGTRWSSVAAHTDVAALSVVSADSPTDAWAIGYTTDDWLMERWNGTRWDAVAGLSPRGLNLESIVAASPTDAVAVGWSGPRGAATAFVEQWNGTSWVRVL